MSHALKIPLWRYLTRLLLIGILIMGAAHSQVIAQPAVAAQKSKILIISPYGPGAPGMDTYIFTLLSTLKFSGIAGDDIFIEYLDLSRNPDLEYRHLQQTLFANKYGNRKIDLIITLLQPSLDFLLQDNKDLAPHAPVMVSLAKLPVDISLSGRHFILQVREVDYQNTLKQALDIFPDTEHVVVIAGASDADEKTRQNIKTALYPWKSKLSFTYTNDLSFEEILNKVATLPRNTIILSEAVLKDKAGHSTISAEFNDKIARAANVPVFVLYDAFVGTGAIGGSVLSIKNEAVRAANTSIELLNGSLLPGETPIQINPNPVPIYDWKQLERWDVDLRKLPKDTIFINHPRTLWGQYQEYVIVSGLIMTAFVLFIVGLLFQSRRRHVAEISLRDSEKRFRVLVEHAPEAILVYDADLQRFVDANPNATQLFGCSLSELLSGGPERFYSPTQPNGESTADSVRDNIQRALDGMAVTVERKVHTVDGRELVCEIRLVKLPSATKELVRISFTDITERKHSEEKIERLAFYDPLTGLPNRRLLQTRLQRALARGERTNEHGALLYLDLDNFKTLNDTLGHDQGDILLQQVARRLNTVLRDTDAVARLGGDEFVVMLEGLSINESEAGSHALSIGKKILTLLEQPYELLGKEHRSTASIGITLFGGSDKNADDLLKRADLAMYEAKAAGRNALCFFNPDMQAMATSRAALEVDLRHSIQLHQFLIYLQAQVDANGRITGAEALLRWHHPARGLISPLEFIPMTEETGLIVPIGEWVLETACLQLVAWAHNPDLSYLTLAVNVSIRQFRQVDFVERTLAILKRTGANPKRLKLELTESVLVADVDSTIGKMSTLKAHGIRFALDDFGTGYSSLSYLKRLPLDQLKIDQSFIRDILTDPNDAAIARTIIALADSMGLSVIAEGVETEEQRDFLARHGCHHYQGRLFSRALTQQAFGEFLDSWRGDDK